MAPVLALVHSVPARVRKPTIDSYEWGIDSAGRDFRKELHSAYPDIQYLFALLKYLRTTIQRYITALDELEPCYEGDPEIQIMIRNRIAELTYQLTE